MVRIRAAALFAIAFLVAIGWPGVSPAQQQPRRKFAFLVGVQNYRRSKLHYPANDVALLKGRLLALGWGVSNIIELVDYDRDEPAPVTRSRITGLLNQFIAARQVGPGDVIVFAYSGHGCSKGGESYLVLSDRINDPAESRVAMSDIYESLQRCRGVDRLVLIDACRSDDPAPAPQAAAEAQAQANPALLPNEAGGLKVLRTGESNFVFNATKVPPNQIFVLSSCNAHESSVEDPGLRSGVFMYKVAEALKNLQHTNKPFGANELNNIVCTAVFAHVEKMKAANPALRDALKGKSQTPRHTAIDLFGPVMLYRPGDLVFEGRGDMRSGSPGHQYLTAWLNEHQKNLKDARFVNADLTGVDLRGVNLTNAHFDGSSLWNANLDGARLDGLKANRSNFTSAKIRNGSAQNSTFTSCRLDYSDWTNTDVNGQEHDNCSMIGVRGLPE